MPPSGSSIEAMPLFPLMHEMTTDHVHEEIQLLAVDFSTMFFETLAPVPTWRGVLPAHDQAPHYRYLRTMLQALQFTRGGDRWVLKSPQHLEQLPVLAATFPGVTAVVTHRDPVDVVVSMATMIVYAARMYTDQVDTAGLGRSWADRIESLLTACMRDRDVLDDEHSLDVRFDEFMADETGTVRAIYELRRPAVRRALRGGRPGVSRRSRTGASRPDRLPGGGRRPRRRRTARAVRPLRGAIPVVAGASSAAFAPRRGPRPSSHPAWREHPWDFSRTHRRTGTLL